MTTDITELAQRMKAAAEKATPGEWWADEVKNEGCYGSGDDCVEGFTSYAIYGSDGQTLFDSLNSDAACICEEYDGEGHVAWDETAQRNAEFIALANPANILALVEALEKAQGMEAYWKTQCRGITDHCEELQARIAELESEVEKWKQEVEAWEQVAEKQLATAIELESRTVKLVDCDFGAVQHMSGGSTDYCHGFVDGTQNAIRSITAAGIKVEAE
ncbi:ead/Ea22-like family protein [Klebsiella quasipneumoniae]|uniref:ead/Ea22-like family protein n=1 Tax=Klebsiella pneumoniae complex TaxID=3390273 RepID=UPI00210B0E3D|nr:ead/Ea22-like family protein [Klebsiella quasipneumoniae]MCQ3852326.1 ead/Ea22-like family protein [Klebsiella quasipneumoniae]